MKKCRCCANVKDLSDFYYSQSDDWRSGICLECWESIVRSVDSLFKEEKKDGKS